MLLAITSIEIRAVVTGVRNGDCLGHAAVHCGGGVLGHDHGHYHPVHLRSVVHVLRSGVRHPLPAADHGRPFQGPVQHVRFAVRVHCRVLHPDGRRRTTVGPQADDPLSRMGRREAAVPVPYHSYALFVVHARVCLMVHQVSTWHGVHLE